MKAPDLAILDDAGVHPWTGATDPLKAAAAHAHLKFAVANLAHAKDRATLFAELDRALKLPEHFGHNFDALADVLEERDWLGKGGRVLALAHAPTTGGTSTTGQHSRTCSRKQPNSGRNGTSGSGRSSPDRRRTPRRGR